MWLSLTKSVQNSVVSGKSVLVEPTPLKFLDLLVTFPTCPLVYVRLGIRTVQSVDLYSITVN